MTSLSAARMNRVSRRALRKLAVTVTPELPGVPLDLDALVRFVEDYRAHMPKMLRLAFPLGLLLLEYGTWLFGFSWRPFSRLPADAAVEYVERWVHARFWARRELIKGTKGLCLCWFYEDARVQSLLGFHPDEHVRVVAAERLKRWGHELAPSA